MVSSYSGIDRWPERWEAKRRVIEGMSADDWRTFRRNKTLMTGIETSNGQLKKWVKDLIAAGQPLELAADSSFGNPETVDVDGILMSGTSARAAYTAWRIEHLAGRMGWELFNPISVAEIGGGYGALMLALSLRTSSIESVSLFDAEPMKVMQTRFLSQNGVPVIEPAANRFDLVTNVNSFGEMEVREVRRYFEIIQQRMATNGLLYIRNRRHRETNFEDYPYDPYWRHIATVWHEDRDWVECLSVRTPGAQSLHPLLTANFLGHVRR